MSFPLARGARELGLEAFKPHHCFVASLSSQARLHTLAMMRQSKPTQSNDVFH